MKLNKFTVILAILLISILAIGAVSAESVDDSDALAVDEDVGEVQESVEATEVAEDLSAADTVDDIVATGPAEEIVNEESSAVLGDDPVSFDLDDDTYSTYFNDDGTAKEILSPSGDYSLNVGTLTNKDIKIISGSNINITAKEGAGFINNGTIYIGDGTDYPGSIIISGLTFTNTNKNAINVNEGSTLITIQKNTMNLVGDSSLDPDNQYLTVTAIQPNNFVYGLNVIDNTISITGDAAYSNGMYVLNYLALANPSNFNISGNIIDINVSGSSGSAAGIYVECSDSIIENNIISVNTVGETFAYGIQIPDMASNNYYEASYEGSATSFNNLAIKNNNININTEYMAYGLTLYNYGTSGFDDEWASYDMFYPNFSTFPLNIVISDNNIFIKSDQGVFGIVGQIYNMSVVNNNLTIIGGSADDVESVDILREGTYALGVQYNGVSEDEDYFVIIRDNNVITNVTGEYTNDDEGYVEFEDNNIISLQNDDGDFIVTEETFDIFFDENGNLKDIIPEGSTVLLGDLSNKKLNINIPLTIKPYDGESSTSNTVINLVEGADGTVIDGITMYFEGDETTGSTALIYANAVENITIKNNKFTVYDFVDKTGAKYGSSIYVIELESGATGCNNALIDGNEISVTGSARYLYGIDVFKTWGAENKNTNVNITNNEISIYGGSRMAEPIYVSDSQDVVIANNTIYSDTGASAYGIGTDGLSNAIISENVIEAESTAMAYAITATNGNDITFEKNTITSTGAGAVGIGLMNDDAVSIKDNTITINGGDYITTTTGDSLGTANAAILDKDNNTNLDIGENVITENVPFIINNDNYATYFNEDGTIKDDSPIVMDSYIVLDKLTNKTLKIDIPVKIEGTAIDTSISLVSGAEGTVINSLDMEATVSSGSFALISVQGVSDISITENNLVIACANGLSGWDMIMPIEIAGGDTGCTDIRITNNNITVTGSAPYVYGIDAYKHWQSENKISDMSIYYNNITLDVDASMAEAIYLSGIKDSEIYGNIINSKCTNAAYGIGTDGLDNTNIESNRITVDAGAMAYGITATMSGENLTVKLNEIVVTGAGAMGVGISGQTNPTISSNDISIDGGDYSNITPTDVLGTGNAAIFEGTGNTNVKIEGNKIDEYSSIKLEASDLTVTAAPSGQGAFEVTVKTMDGKALADKELTFSFNNQVIKATTDANGIAKLSFDLNKAGKYPVSVAFLGDKHYKGAFTTATITINPIKTSLSSAAKTYLATAKTKSLTATLKDANGKALAKKKVTFTVNGKTVTATTNAKGVATAKLALTAAKTYTVTIKFAGDGVYAASTVSAKVKLNKEKTKVTAPKKTFKKSKKVKKIVVKLKNSKGKAIAKKKVTLTVNKKKYTAKTNKKGKATFKVKKLTKKGTKKYTVKFAGDSQYKACKKTGKIKIK